MEHQGRRYPLRIDWADAGAAVGPDNPTMPPPVWPMSGKTVPSWSTERGGLTGDPAAQLAEMIRSDPSLLEDGR